MQEQGKSSSKKRTGGIIAGSVLMLLGSLFLLDRLDLFEVGRIWRWWPLIPLGMGLAKLATADGHRELRSAVWLTVVGAWMLLSTQRWYGFHWGNSWPLLLIALGAVTIWQALAERGSRDDNEGGSREG
jgi:Domain of unknown function (DUF5668)